MANYNKQDIKFQSEDNFHEEVFARFDDLVLTEELETLWQAVVGELKTQIGEVKCIHLANYGSHLPDLVGEKLNDEFNQKVYFYCGEVCDNYDVIESYNISGIKLEGSGFRFTLTILTDRGKLSGVVEIG